MGSALAGGMLARGARAAELRFVEPNAAQRDKLAARFPGAIVHPQCDAAAIAGADLIVFAVKPQYMREAARAAAPHLARSQAVVLSIAAGIRVADLARWLGGYRRIVRAMPNTPALVREGVAAVAGGAHATDAHVETARRLLGAVGAVVVVPEAALDAVTGLSGSGPAYVFLLAEAMIEAGVLNGLPRDVATALVHGTIRGAGVMLTDSGDAAEQLRAAVTSPGGTTAAGLRALEVGGMRAAVLEAVSEATRRSRELGG